MSRSRRHRWDKDKCPKLPAHSQAKHEILSKYIKKYLHIVCKNRRIEKFNLTLVDGFSGGGKYENGEPGSPFVMLESVDSACVEINSHRDKKVNIDPYYFFVEKDHDNYAQLAKHLTASKYADKINNAIITRNGDFNFHVKEIVDCIKKRNPKGGGGVIFFLDQDGYSAVSVEVLNYIKRNLPQSEVIINISISWLIDFINNQDNFKKKIIDMGLENHVNINEIFELSKDISDNRYIIESKLSDSLRQAVGYEYFRPFFIEPVDNHRGYWLLHLSPHFRAHNAMSEVTWSMGNNMRHYGGIGTRIFDLSYKPSDEASLELPGMSFNDAAKQEHIGGLMDDLPKLIWSQEQIIVNKLVEMTCNNTASTREMYLSSLSELRQNNEIEVRGKNMGIKRGSSIDINDVVIPKKQIMLI